jgi:hypothetical protein
VVVNELLFVATVLVAVRFTLPLVVTVPPPLCVAVALAVEPAARVALPWELNAAPVEFGLTVYLPEAVPVMVLPPVLVAVPVADPEPV